MRGCCFRARLAQIQRTLAAVRDDVNGIDAGLALQVGRHLAQAVGVAIQNEHLRWLGQAVDQRLVACDTGVDEDDAGGHGVLS